MHAGALQRGFPLAPESPIPHEHDASERIDTVIARLARARWPDPAVPRQPGPAVQCDGIAGVRALGPQELALVVDRHDGGRDRARVHLHFELGKLV